MLRPVLLLALGLVALTVVAVGYLMHWLVPAMPLAVAFTLGAIVSPTDAVATVATTRELPLPARVVQIVNAESLLNDASGPGRLQARRRCRRDGPLLVCGHRAAVLSCWRAAASAVGMLVEWLGRRLHAAADPAGGDDPTVQSRC